MQKKENAKVKEEIEFYERIIEEKEDDEEVETGSIAYQGMQSKISGGTLKREMSANKSTNAM
jgi:hypothetical protein